MANGAVEDPSVKKLIAKLDTHWDDEFCAEHNGTIASFEALDERLDDLIDFRRLLERKHFNAKRMSQAVLLSVGSAAVIAPLAFFAAPGVASALGAGGVLGAAGTGTAIVTLHGAALSGASLAAIGGTVAGGVTIITAAGAALGASTGAVVFNAYAGQVKQFDIRLCRSGTGPAVVFVDGFLTQASEGHDEWVAGARSHFRGPLYHLRWESKRLATIGKLFAGAATGQAATRAAKILAVRGAKRFANPLVVVQGGLIALSLIKNPWHVAQVRAAMAGAMLADLLARTDHSEGFILIGHSLGARVIRYALEALSTRSTSIIREVHLLGGAITHQGWEHACTAVDGRVFNHRSDHDLVLGALYRVGNLFTSRPVGRHPIEGAPANVVEMNTSEVVGGHFEYRPKLGEVLSRIKR